MKKLSIILEDNTFGNAELFSTKLNVTRNNYFNEGVGTFNKYNKRKFLKTQLLKESKLTSKEKMSVLKEFEKLID